LTPPPFPFIVGRGRSGTTLLRAMLDAHPDMAIPDEASFLGRLIRARRSFERPDGFAVEAFLDRLLGSQGFLLWGLAPDEVRKSFTTDPPDGFPAAARRIYALNARRCGKTRYGDKTPVFVMSMPLVASVLPEARFVHLIRDGRDVAVSRLQMGLTPTGSVAGQALYWRRFVERGRADGRRLGTERYMELTYEALLEEPERHLREVCDFVDIGFVPEMLRYFERADTMITTGLHARIHQALYMRPTKGLRDWRRDMNRRDTLVFEAIAGDLLGALGYERVSTTIPLSVRIAAYGRLVGANATRIISRIDQIIRRATRRPPRRDRLAAVAPGDSMPVG
jgi:hypothetical protein